MNESTAKNMHIYITRCKESHKLAKLTIQYEKMKV